jgi:hypothetical protein
MKTESVKRMTDKGGLLCFWRSVVRSTDSFSTSDLPPSDQSLGYFQSSASADWGTAPLFVQNRAGEG